MEYLVKTSTVLELISELKRLDYEHFNFHRTSGALSNLAEPPQVYIKTSSGQYADLKVNLVPGIGIVIEENQ